MGDIKGCFLVPGGFGDRGMQGMILAAKYARESKVPYLEICLDMQISVIEFARSVLGWKMANCTKFDDQTPDPVMGVGDYNSFNPKKNTYKESYRRTIGNQHLKQTKDVIGLRPLSLFLSLDLLNLCLIAQLSSRKFIFCSQISDILSHLSSSRSTEAQISEEIYENEACIQYVVEF